MPAATYTISDLAKEFDVTTRTIRFYEEKGLITPQRDGSKRLYTAADRVRIKLILRGKRIGMSLRESVEFIDMYDPQHNNEEQLQSLLDDTEVRRRRLMQQKKDINDMLAALQDVQRLCRQALSEKASARQHSNPGTNHRKPL